MRTQVLYGPRQVLKTTLALQVAEQVQCPVHYASADAPALQDMVWLEQHWKLARRQATQDPVVGALLILDEVQKLRAWSELVKRLWDEDTVAHQNVRVLLLGSSPWLLSRGLHESLAGRFEMIPIPLNQDPELWGRWVESAVGAHLLNQSMATRMEVTYWHEGNYEVDFVVCHGPDIVAIEMKSGRRKDKFSGLAAFQKAYPHARLLVVGHQGVGVEEFLRTPLTQWLANDSARSP